MIEKILELIDTEKKIIKLQVSSHFAKLASSLIIFLIITFLSIFVFICFELLIYNLINTLSENILFSLLIIFLLNFTLLFTFIFGKFSKILASKIKNWYLNSIEND